MAKKKNSESLFEVLSTKQGSVEVPEWMHKKAPELSPPKTEDKDETSEDPQTPDEQSPPVEPEVTEVERPEDIEETPDIETEYEPEANEDAVGPKRHFPKPFLDYTSDRGPMLRIEGDRIRFSLNFVTAMVVLGGVAVLLVAAFVRGRVTGGGANSPGATKAGLPDAPPRRVKLAPVETSDDPIRSESGKRDPNRYYIIIETLKENENADKVEAERIIKFCKSRDIPANMVLIGRDRRLAVWCLLGFKSARSSAAIKHAEKIEELGREYFKEHKTYKFLQRRNGEFSPFFYPGSSENADN